MYKCVNHIKTVENQRSQKKTLETEKDFHGQVVFMVSRKTFNLHRPLNRLFLYQRAYITLTALWYFRLEVLKRFSKVCFMNMEPLENTELAFRVCRSMITCCGRKCQDTTWQLVSKMKSLVYTIFSTISIWKSQQDAYGLFITKKYQAVTIFLIFMF